jgi:hypothetical protein
LMRCCFMAVSLGWNTSFLCKKTGGGVLEPD